MNSLPPEQRTIVTEDILGSKIEAIPGMGVCDFCTDIPVVVAYPCGLVVVETPIGTHASSDPWGACADCHAMIEANDRDGLVQRSSANFAREQGATSAEDLAFIARMIRDVQAGFFAARLGDPQPL
jgi:hypothetical protein